MDDNFLLIDKPAGMTSFGVVARVRRVLSEKAGHKVKVGHTGTLDPFATGLLILLTGKGTKRSNEFLKLDKWYETTIRLGVTSSTGDPEGEIIGNSLRNAPRIDSSEVERAVQGFVGEIEQRVPNFSAVKINGERAYKLARKGVDVEMPVRKVQIYQIDILDYKWPELKIRCHVSSGTYIRTLGEDIGAALGVGGYLTALRRTQIGEYKVDDAIKLEDFMGA
ncbi:tRNA pseudouridine(55) synthase TruB [Candidatus Saccharibacteria bacterium]|nr:tRNA pseudouridine(55) synthase TruB [Candidatus Saccharibacteria bacterium]